MFSNAFRNVWSAFEEILGIGDALTVVKVEHLWRNFLSLCRSDPELRKFMHSNPELMDLVCRHGATVMLSAKNLLDFSQDVFSLMQKKDIKIINHCNPEEMADFYSGKKSETYEVRVYNFIWHITLGLGLKLSK